MPTGTQTLTWADTGNVATVTSTSGSTSYTYDADGSELLRHDPGSTTLYLPGEQLVLNTMTNTVTGVRFYALPSGGQAERTGSGTNYTFEVSDQQGTALLALDYTAQNPTWRQQTPYGAPRGSTPTAWPDDRGFLDKPADPTTGLIDDGARPYDPVNGRFLSLDPQLNPADPQSMTGYEYADDNPTTQADPTGLCPADRCGGGVPKGGSGGGVTNGPVDPSNPSAGTVDGSGIVHKPRSHPSDPPPLHDGAGNVVSCPYAMGLGCAALPGGADIPDGGLGPSCQFTGNGYRSCVAPAVDDVVNTNHCGGWGWLCDLLPINSAINCFDNPNFDQCTLAVIDAGTTISVIGKGAKLATKGIDLLAKLGAKSATSVDPKLLQEMAENGVKFDPSSVLRAARTADNQIVFLETGNDSAGLTHIINAHGRDFANVGINEDEIPDLVMDAVTRGDQVGIQGRGRPIYQVDFGGRTYNVAVTVGSNGFIVGANPG